ncbi:serine hydrolase [Maribacter polysiphoniae]|uniref:CubicO group peptidase (Beta-lactamase class C family) n=1 Tax=Maribacter polysiphoniae TaxID=429344 RepID=A0A316E0A0_9FLAO|nr:serine hydrolase [Maribacter polysiphoniae]MBD1260809.1 serine hydrolase [Maribacter polysiphoniae]PWK24057.1 CubicO group peptidase (beta-lactamase class C family) [Maribacter polysiphoniae]
MKKFLYLFIFSFFISIGIQGQEKKQVDLKALDNYFAKMVKDWDVPGASIGIVKDGKLVFTGNYGVLEKGKKGKPNAQTLYAIASNSKAFTSAIIGMLVQEGKLDWNDKVKKYLPYFAMYDPWVSEHITIRDILSHRVGLGTFSGDNIWYKSNFTAKEIIERIQYVPQAYEFRSGYGYSNLMYITAGEIIKTITGKSWGENVKERILEPLGMDRSIYSLKDLDSKGNYAQPHARKNDENYVIPWVDWENVGATGGLISSVGDISKWMIFNLNNGVHNGDTLLTKATRNMVWTPHNNFKVDHTADNDFDRHFSGYGLGWGLSDYHGRMRVGHTGGYDGFITAINLIPDENLGVVVLTNGVKSPIMAASYYALDTFLGIENGKDWSADLLERTNKHAASDTRIADRKSKRVLGTKPSVALDKMVGDYTSDLCGKISIGENNGELRLVFDNHPLLSAKLTHWHYDVWEIHWDHPQAWFGFGTIKLRTDNNLKVLGFDFDVPNDDFFFEELKPYKR